jgi:uncharacterized membrane protein YfcA
MDLPDIALYFTIAAIGSAVNAVAGGGTFLTFPVLIMNGLTPLAANIASTIALWPGSLMSAFAYRKELQVEKRLLWRLMVISVIGSALGAWVLLSTPEKIFAELVPWLLLFATFVFTFGGNIARHSRAILNSDQQKNWIPACAGMMAIAFYGGYFGAGIGILMLALLTLMGMQHIHAMNALKTILGSSINAVAVVIFVASGNVKWDIALVMVAGALVGGFFGAKGALRVSPRVLRYVVSTIGFIASAYFFLR